MSKLDRSSLLKFLLRPRFVHEVADRYGISKKLANFHILEAIKSGEVLISEKPIFKTLRNSKGKLERLGEYVYVFRNSPMLVGGWAKFRMRETDNLISKPDGDAFSTRFLSKTPSSLGKESSNHKRSALAFEETEGSRDIVHHFKTGDHLSSGFDVSSSKVKLTKRRTINQLIMPTKGLAQEETKSLSQKDRIHLFQALSEEPRHFLDLRAHFGVSKRTIRSLVKNGLLTETWGPSSVGVRYNLSRKGKMLLKELEAASRYRPVSKENPLIRLRSRLS